MIVHFLILLLFTFIHPISAQFHDTFIKTIVKSNNINISPQKRSPHTVIDVVIPCTEKDLPTLHYCIDGIRTYGTNIHRIIIVSEKQLTNAAEWFNEQLYPFTKFDIACAIFNGDETQARAYINDPRSRIGWIYQQLLKLYAPFVIPNILPNVLILDADTIFLRPISFFDKRGYALYNPGSEYHMPYFEHMERTLPSRLYRVYPQYSGVSHHMLFQRNLLYKLLQAIEEHHRMPAWQALCRCIDHKHLYGSALSEYEMYFNFIMSQKNDVKIRPLTWANINNLGVIALYQERNYDYVSCHWYLR